jgi:phosphotriesterase-related protein
MTAIETIKGPLEPQDLGWTLMHEHVFVKNPELEHNYPSPEWDEEAMFQTAVNGLKALHDRGVRSFVDLTVMGLGRSVERIQRVAAETDVNILVATGYYTQKDLPAYFHNHGPNLYADVPEPLVDMFLRDIRDGINDTGVKAAAIKIVTDQWGLTPDLKRIFEAAATAHLETGVPITTHTNASHRGGLAQQAVLSDLGVDLTRVVIGHCGDTTNLDYLKEIMDAGSSIGMDRFGMDIMATEDDRIDTVVRLCELGYADRMTMSHDASFFSVNMEPSVRNRIMPNWNHLNLSDRILPEVRRRGVSDETIEQIMVTNPQRIMTPSV